MMSINWEQLMKPFSLYTLKEPDMDGTCAKLVVKRKLLIAKNSMRDGTVKTIQLLG